MNAPTAPIELDRRQRFFLKYCCFPPPGRPPRPLGNHLSVDNPLGLLRHYYGSAFDEAIRDRVVVDIGCGHGDQVIGAAQAGAGRAVGIEMRPIVDEARAAALGVADRITFTTRPIAELGTAWADVAFSQNSFEHFGNPAQILADAWGALKPGGTFFVTFGPPWWNPFGVHQFFMIKYPWMHFIFSERTILGVRRLYRPDQAMRWADTDGGLNQMTIAKFVGLVEASGFTMTRLALTPIRPLPAAIANLRLWREFTTSHVSAVLTKPAV